jgi:hypothetical protein
MTRNEESKQMAIKFISDPGHGWLEVTTQACAAVGLTAQSFSRYSYRKGNTFYLEEDCDANVFMHAFKAKFDTLPHLESVYHERTFIRSLPRIW